ncbi:MAG: type II toxin-antitoxin system HicB family antitoxin [Phycisphaeraceae bacterium]|nr:MAG: type II toxin-antitoxin system HicB family antitoxin [Phycisphaeraceae bacterium]
MRQVILYQDEDGIWVAEVPSLPGCISQGATRDEAMANIREAAIAWIEAVREMGEPVPSSDEDRRVEVDTLTET